MAASCSQTESYSLELEKLLAIIKPKTMNKCAEIQDILTKNGFTILQKKKLLLTKKHASDFYIEHEEKPFFQELVNFMTSGPILVMVLAGHNIMSHWRNVVGPSDPKLARYSYPHSIRALYGGEKEHDNAIHGSDSLTSGEREIKFFFPSILFEANLKSVKASEYLAKTVSITLVKGLVELRKKEPENPIVWLAKWLQENNPNKPMMR